MFTRISTLLVVLTFCISINLCSQNLCPWKRVDCINGCGRYTDNNGDKYCDLGGLSSQINVDTHKVTDVKVDTVKVDDIKVNNDTTEVVQNNTNSNNNKVVVKNNTNNSNINNNVTNDVNQNNQSEIIVNKNNDTVVQQNNNTPINKNKKPSRKPYNLIWIGLGTFLLYFTTLFLSKKNVIKKYQHRKIWNVLLLITFLVSGLFGLFLVIQINYNFAFDIFKTILYWHVQFGIAMSLIAIFHFLWHLKYYVNMLKKKANEEKN